jgi:dipeptidyl aminopeptidase/acylaminoacyl peptidase
MDYIIKTFFKMKNYLFYFLLLFSTQLSFAQQNTLKPIEVTDMLKIKTIGKPQISPDGLHVLFSIMEIKDDVDKKGDFAYITQLYLGEIKSKSYRALTSGKYSISSPSWSPDGRSILFSRDMGNKSQAYIMKLNGGEPMALTTSSRGVINPVWSKDGQFVFYQERKSMKEFLLDSLTNPSKFIPSWNIEKPKLDANVYTFSSKVNPNGNLNEVRAYLYQNEKDKKAKVINRLNFQEETTTTGEFQINLLFKISVDGPSKPILINNPYELWTEWVETTKGIMAIIPVDSLTHPDRVLDHKIVVYNRLNNQYRTLVEKKGFAYSNINLSPDGNWITFVETSTSIVQNGTFKILNLTNSTILDVPLDRAITQIKWSENNENIYFTAQDRGGVPIFVFNLKSKKVKQITSEVDGVLGFDVKDANFMYSKTCVDNPSELYVNDLEGKSESIFTNENSTWLVGKSISKPIKKSFINNKGQRVEYWIMKPMNYQTGTQYPLVVDIHGGPSAMWGTGEASMWHEFQYYASKGLGVVYGNPRGSGGYGTNFLAANVKDWGAGPMSDIMQMTDLAVKEGWVDTTQLAVTGGSYAGYLVTWMLGHTNRFKVACSQRGVYELSTFFGEGNAWRLNPRYFGGYPWEKATRVILDRESPMTYVQNIRTPLIIFHGENDLRTGVIGSEILYKSLKILGRDVEYVRHPEASHEITRAGNNRQRIDQMLRTYEFFSRYLKVN